MRTAVPILNEPTGTRTIYRRRFNNAWCSLCALAVAIAFTIGVIDWSPSGKGVLGTLGVVLIAGVPAVLGWYLAVRYVMHGVVADESGILIRNGLRSHRLAWAEMDHFEYARCDPWPRIGVAVLRSGRRIAMTGLQRGYVGDFPERAVDALNGQLAQR